MPKKRKRKSGASSEPAAKRQHPDPFTVWHNTSICNHLLTRGIVVLDCCTFGEYPYTIQVLGSVVGTPLADSKLLKAKFESLPQSFDIQLTDQAWVTDCNVKTDILPVPGSQCTIYLATKPDSIHMAFLKRFEMDTGWAWCASLYTNRRIVKLSYIGNFKYFGYLFPASIYINWDLTTEYHHDRDNYPFLRDLIRPLLQDNSLIEIVVAFFEHLMPLVRGFRLPQAPDNMRLPPQAY